MSVLSEKNAEINRSLDALESRVMTHIGGLRADLAEARKAASTPEELQALDNIDRRVDAFDPTKPGVIVEELPAPAVRRPVARKG